MPRELRAGAITRVESMAPGERADHSAAAANASSRCAASRKSAGLVMLYLSRTARGAGSYADVQDHGRPPFGPQAIAKTTKRDGQNRTTGSLRDAGRPADPLPLTVRP